MSTPGQRPSSSSRDLTLVVESESGTPEEYFAQVGLSIGRANSNTIHIDHPDVDRIHAKVVKREESYWLRCEGQAKLKVSEPEPGEVGEVELIPGLTIELGGTILRCRRQVLGMMGSGDDYWAQEVGGETIDVDAPDFKGVLPKKIGPYEIRKYVARGGMGIVLQGLHEETAHLAAVKLPTPDLNRNEQWLRRFEKEVQTLKKLVHPNLVRLQDAGKAGNLQWLAMDWVEGSTVAQKLSAYKKDNQPMPLPEIKMILKQVVEGLKYLHSKKVVHRDLKPANLLMGQDEGVKVADFGLAKQVEGDRSTFMTQTGTLAGTMYYMAPEQAEGLEVTFAADIYAFGVIWFELLTTKKPGVGTLKIQKHRPDCPSAWEEIIGQCLDSEPEDRPGLSRIKQVLEAEAFASDIDDKEEEERKQKEEEECRKKEAEARRKKADAETGGTDTGRRTRFGWVKTPGPDTKETEKRRKKADGEGQAAAKRVLEKLRKEQHPKKEKTKDPNMYIMVPTVPCIIYMLHTANWNTAPDGGFWWVICFMVIAVLGLILSMGAAMVEHKGSNKTGSWPVASVTLAVLHLVCSLMGSAGEEMVWGDIGRLIVLFFYFVFSVAFYVEEFKPKWKFWVLLFSPSVLYWIFTIKKTLDTYKG